MDAYSHDCAVKSLVTVEYRHAVISSNVALLLEGLEILQMAHVIVFYQRLLICVYLFPSLYASYNLCNVSSIVVAITD